MLKAHWQSQTITTNAQAYDMVKLFKNTQAIAGAFDTETDGLHIILCKPFLFQFGWVTEDLQGFTFAVDLEQQPILAKQVIRAWHILAEELPIYLAHNVKFDLHMLINAGIPYTATNVSDTLFYIRYAHDALQPKEGGPPLQLKKYATQYIDGSARQHEKLLNKEKTEIAKNLNCILKIKLKGYKPPAKFKAKSYTLTVFNEMFKDPIFTADQLPEDIRSIYYDWLNNDVPLWLQNKITSLVEADMIPYNKLNRKNLIKYAHYDIIWVLEIWLKLNPVIIARGNMTGVNIENNLIYPLLEMERVGFKIDKPYLLSCKTKMVEYIKERRAALYVLAGEEIKIGQAIRIRTLIKTKFNREIESTNGEILDQLCGTIAHCSTENYTSNDYDRDLHAVQFIYILKELRTLEKWYSAYIIRFIKDLKTTDRLYTTIHQVGTVSGRVTSDFQQFPKDAIKTINNTEIFSPRKMIEITGGDYDSIIYLDYSQIELRFQALYTILVGHPDLNLCRAYMPYNCFYTNSQNNTIAFDYNNPEHIKQAYTQDWYLNEEPGSKWTPTDVHAATTKAAFNIDETHPDFKHLRYVGKRVNFAKNYGAQYNKICTMFPERTAEECRRIDNAYYTAFPGVKQYHSYCYDRAPYAYTTNLFGVRYYGVSGHKLINVLVQGSAAYYLKLKIIDLYLYSKQHNIKTRWQMQIHDELSWEHYVDEDPQLFFEYKKLMETWEEGIVPIIADMEITKSTWAQKEDVNTIEDIQKCLSS